MARSFNDASSEYLEYAGAVLSDRPLTMSGFYKTNDTGASQMVLTINAPTTSAYIELGLRPDSAALGNSVDFRLQEAGAYIAYATTAITGNVWEHAAGSVDASGNLSAYINGGSKGYNNFAGPAVAKTNTYTQTNIGAIESFSSYSDFMSGDLAEVGLWDVQLTDGEIATLALGYSPVLVRPQSLVAYWPLIGRASPEIDIVGGYDMTLVNTPTTAAHPRIIYPGSRIYTPPAVAAPAGIPAHFMHYAKMRRG